MKSPAWLLSWTGLKEGMGWGSRGRARTVPLGQTFEEAGCEPGASYAGLQEEASAYFACNGVTVVGKRTLANNRRMLSPGDYLVNSDPGYSFLGLGHELLP